jgi:hypothetical protein
MPSHRERTPAARARDTKRHFLFAGGRRVKHFFPGTNALGEKINAKTLRVRKFPRIFTLFVTVCMRRRKFRLFLAALL